jgi:SAM-dependent methyltransferase
MRSQNPSACGLVAESALCPVTMKLTTADLARITASTLGHYDQRATQYWEGTRDHDVRQNIAALLRHIAAEPPCAILDFGCGPGRDLPAFTAHGHVAVGLEGSPRFADMARANSGCEVWQQDFLALDLPSGHFHGIFANAVLFHIPSQELPRVLRQLRATLKPGGVLFSSNPRGTNEEGWSGERYGTYHDLETWRGYLLAAGFVELEHYYRPPGLPRAQQPWLATVWRRTEGDCNTPAA